MLKVVDFYTFFFFFTINIVPIQLIAVSFLANLTNLPELGGFY